MPTIKFGKCFAGFMIQIALLTFENWRMECAQLMDSAGLDSVERLLLEEIAALSEIRFAEVEEIK